MQRVGRCNLMGVQIGVVVGLVGRWYGVDCYNCDITETVENFIWEPVVVKRNALAAATEVLRLGRGDYVLV